MMTLYVLQKKLLFRSRQHHHTSSLFLVVVTYMPFTNCIVTSFPTYLLALNFLQALTGICRNRNRKKYEFISIKGMEYRYAFIHTNSLSFGLVSQI